MHEMMQLLTKIADRGPGSWPRFATLLAFALLVALYKTVSDLPSLGRLLVTAAALVFIAFCLEFLHRRFLLPASKDRAPRSRRKNSNDRKKRKLERRIVSRPVQSPPTKPRR